MEIMVYLQHCTVSSFIVTGRSEVQEVWDNYLRIFSILN